MSNNSHRRNGRFAVGNPGGPGRPPGSADQGQISARELHAAIAKAAVETVKQINDGEVGLVGLLVEAAKRDILGWWRTMARIFPPKLDTDPGNPDDAPERLTAQDVITIMNQIKREQAEKARETRQCPTCSEHLDEAALERVLRN